MNAISRNTDMPSLILDALEPGGTLRDGAVGAPIGQILQLDTQGLESYFFADWNPVLIDLLIVAAAAEFCDVSRRRPEYSWSRRFDVRIAVHDPAHWKRPDVREALEEGGFVFDLHIQRVNQQDGRFAARIMRPAEP